MTPNPLTDLLFRAMRASGDPALRRWFGRLLSGGVKDMTALHLAGVLSDTALLVLAHAARRNREHVLPTKGVSGYTRASVLKMLRRLDLITDGPCPALTDLGREVAAIYLGCTLAQENAP